MDDKVPKLGGSLAYFTLFSLGPIFLVAIFLAGLLLGRQAIEGSLHNQIQGLVGEDAARQLQEIIKSAAVSKDSTIAGFIGIVTLLVGTTSVFAEIQDSINGIWKLKVKPKLGWQFMLRNRLVSFGIVATIGFLLLVSLTASAIIESLGTNLAKILPGISIVIFYVINQAFTLLLATVLFGMVFKILPSAKISWRDVWPGALVTSVLFMAGRFAISFYIIASDLGATYGAAGSLVVLLVWIYYSSLILYFGAEFAKAYAKRFGSGLQPNAYAISTADEGTSVTISR